MARMRAREIDILVGTQMVTKGLDFDRVNLVGVFDADRIIHFPDFRSYERAFQLITQVSGRAGRRDSLGQVLIQTHNPKHPIFRQITTHDVIGFLEEQLYDRKQGFYPPYSRVINITLKHKNKSTCERAADQFANHLKTIRDLYVFGPAEPIISKIRNEFIQSIMIKIPRDYGRLSSIKHQIKLQEEALSNEASFRGTKLIFDVDPN